MSTSDRRPKYAPTADIAVAQARAYLAGVSYGFHILLEEWEGIGDGTAKTSDCEGTTLIYTGDTLHPFDAIIPCRQHSRHRVGVTHPAQLDKARADTAACSDSADAETVALRLTDRKPTPLWLVNRAADMADETDDANRKPA